MFLSTVIPTGTKIKLTLNFENVTDDINHIVIIIKYKLHSSITDPLNYYFNTYCFLPHHCNLHQLEL